MFPSRALKKELDEAKKKLQNMEDELLELRRQEMRPTIEQVLFRATPLNLYSLPPLISPPLIYLWVAMNT